eukprot:m.174322 g.174322  ORF g.174322 m.174322 type:complete len:892 (-) comp13817_c0_seq1:236-2911(-)
MSRDAAARSGGGPKSFQYDIVVMGGGPAAFALALRIANQDQTKGPPKTLGILSSNTEDGGNLTELMQGKLSGLLDTRAYKDYLYMGRLREFGGTTNHWGGWNWPFEKYEISDWPIEYEEMVKYWKIVQNEFMDMGSPEETQFHYDDVDWWVKEAQRLGKPPLEKMPDTEALKTRILQVRNCNFKDVHLQKLKDCPWITIHHNCNVVALETVEKGDQCQVTTMVAKELEDGRVGRTLYFNAAQHVLAAGAIENTRFLLLNKTKQFPTGIGNSSGHLGQHFRDQTFFNNYDMASFTLRDDIPEGIRNLYFKVEGNNLHGKSTFTATLVPKPEFVAKKNILPFRCVFGGVDQTPAIGIIAGSAGVEDSKDGYITLTDELPPDVFGLPRVEVKWALTEKTNMTGRIMFEETFKALAPYIVESQSVHPGKIDDSVWFPDLHPEGTTRMAARREDGVVDADLKVFDTTNLFVTGSSTFPTSGYENPTFSIVALATRLADHLLGLDYGCPPPPGPTIPIIVGPQPTIDGTIAKLQDALMLELSTLPLYLTMMYSLKEGTPWFKFAYPRLWSIVKQEMMHMNLVGNILNALGAQPEFNNPERVPKYPGQGLPGGCLASLKYALGPFSMKQVEVFLDIEHPREASEQLINSPISKEIRAFIKKEADFPKDEQTIGQFYERIADELRYLDALYGPKLWKGDPTRQVVAWGKQLGGTTVPVTDLFTALQSIDEVVKEGEGTSVANPDDGQCELAHFFKFVELRAQKPILKSEEGYVFGPEQVPFDQKHDVLDVVHLDTPAKGRYTGAAAAANGGLTTAYSALLDGLNDAFDGKPSRVPMMVDIPKDCAFVMGCKLEGSHQFACPTFEYKRNAPPELAAAAKGAAAKRSREEHTSRASKHPRK